MRSWRRFWTLPPSDRRLTVRVAALLVATRVGLWLLPFSTVRHLLDRVARRSDTRADRTNLPARVGWVVAAVARRLPATTCLAQALAADALLRRHGFSPHLRIGVREPDRADGRPLDSHAWVECGGTVVVGALDSLVSYAVLSHQ